MEREKRQAAAARAPFESRSRAEVARCDHPGCDEIGEFRAPRSRENLESFYWFCRPHAREYNATWNYCAGMDERAIEAEVRQDTVWRRPTWPLGARGGMPRMRDPLTLFPGEDTEDPARARAAQIQMQAMSAAERAALATLGLEAPVTLEDVKLRYKTLAKTLHPDANGGDKRAEDRLKSVNHAYTTLRHSDRLA